MQLEGKVALITGSGQGIGKATAWALAREGANVVLNDIVDERLKQAAADIRATGVQALAVKADVADSAQVTQMVEQAIKTFGRIDILVNNVGVGRVGWGIEMTEEDFKHLVDLNLKSQYLCCYAVVPHMKKQGSGRIVNISSAAGKYRAMFSDLAYTAAKAGVLGLTRFLATDLGPHGINVNCIAPGNVLTEEGEKDWYSLPEEQREEILSGTPLRRLARPEEIANAVLFLVSDNASYITGVCLDVNGGLWMS